MVSLRTLWKDVQEQGEGVLVELGSISVVECGSSTAVPSPIQEVLASFRRVFEWTDSLQPQRARDHAITLQAGFLRLAYGHTDIPIFRKRRSSGWFVKCWRRGLFSQAIVLSLVRCSSLRRRTGVGDFV